jgi:glycosyltransferase involved in cell wall biosynthesis
MNIAIDITPIIYQRGVSRYTKNLALALIQKKHSLSLFGYSFGQKEFLQNEAKRILAESDSSLSTSSSTILPLPQSLMSLMWQLGIFPVKKRLPDAQVFHSWDWLQPPDRDLPVVSTIHDLAVFKYDSTIHPKIKKAHLRSLSILKKNNSHVIAVSHATKKDLEELFGFQPHLVHVVHEALPVEFSTVTQSIKEDDHERMIAKLNIDRPYIFFVGTREPRKNLDRLIEAWQPLAKEFDLIVAGASGWDQTSTNPNKYNQPQLRFLGQVNDKELSTLYAQASLFAYPSLEEGFGLPILEAFHHGTPVVTSNAGGTLEVAGNAAELVDPTSVESIRQGLRKVLDEDIEAQRKRLQKMIVRQHMFSWSKVADETLLVYQQALEDFNE